MEKCGCGKTVKYFIREKPSCNKHFVCPTYAELSERLIVRTQVLWNIYHLGTLTLTDEIFEQVEKVIAPNSYRETDKNMKGD